jgi:hypothetical protein
MPQVDFQIPKTLESFFTSTKFLSIAVGPVGSLKTTTALAKILYHASKMAPCTDGIRRSKCVWVRNTREQLRDSSIPDFLKWYPDGVFGTYLKTEGKYLLKVGDIECEVLFRGLDDAQDVRRLLSLNVSFGVLEECREINPLIAEQLQGRLGRYPDGSLVPHRPEWGVDGKGNPIQGCVTDEGKANKLLWAVTNPPDLDSYWEELISNPPDNAHITIQPSAFDPEADWVHHLPSDYYENLAEGKSEDWVDVYIHAKFGKSLAGQPVHRSFNRGTHIAKNPLKHNPVSSQPIIVGYDAALNPAAVVGQMGFDGRLMVLDCLHAEGMGSLRFTREKLKPLLTQKYPGAKVLVIVDPSGVRRMDTDEQSVVQLIKAEGLSVKPARTNKIAIRLAAVENFLTRMVDGKPAIIIDPGCEALIKALAGKYRYKIKKPGTLDEQVDEDQPEKFHPWSDVADALQYLCMHADNGTVMGAAVSGARREIKPAPFKWAVG